MFLAASPIVEVEARALGNSGRYSGDNVLVSLRFAQRLRGNDQLSRQWRSGIFEGAHRSIRRRQHRVPGGFSPSGTGARRAAKKRSIRAGVRTKDIAASGTLLSQSVLRQNEAPIRFEELVCSTLATLRIDEVGGHRKAACSGLRCIPRIDSENIQRQFKPDCQLDTNDPIRRATSLGDKGSSCSFWASTCFMPTPQRRSCSTAK